MVKKIPKGYKQYNAILPIHTIEQLKEICVYDKRSQPKELEWLIEERLKLIKEER